MRRVYTFQLYSIRFRFPYFEPLNGPHSNVGTAFVILSSVVGAINSYISLSLNNQLSIPEGGLDNPKLWLIRHFNRFRHMSVHILPSKGLEVGISFPENRNHNFRVNLWFYILISSLMRSRLLHYSLSFSKISFIE